MLCFCFTSESLLILRKSSCVVTDVIGIIIIPIHHFHIDRNELCLPPELFYITIASNWILQLSQEKSKTIVMQNFGR